MGDHDREPQEAEELGDDLWLAVWLPTSNSMLRDDGLAPFEEFASSLGDSLEKQGLGYFEGAITGEKTANLTFTLNPSGDAERAVAIVLTRLRELGLERRAIVAKCGFITRDGKHSRLEEAVWPPGYQGQLPR